MDRPAAGGFLSLTGPSAPRVVDCPSGNTYKVSVTGLAFSVIWHDTHSGDWLTAFAPPLSGCAIGHAFGARVQRVQKVQRVQRVVVAPFGRNHHTWRRTSPVVSGQRSADSGQRTADSSQPSANACYPAKGTLKGISIQNTHASMTWFSKSAAGVIVEGAGRKDVSFPIISFEEAYYGELQSL